ncbi:MAG TPA: C2 family cysteine protease [Verrucomicrobiae bacterium]|jgi:hypothetical protein|nr:C2 family cysteine protease [Verrucomicrobiae bacterium]
MYHFIMRKLLILIFALPLGLNAWTCQAKPKPQIDQAQKDAEFRQLFTNAFAQWDVNHDGKLDLKEINAVIENPQIHGDEAAIAVIFHAHIPVNDEGDIGNLTLDQVLALAVDPQEQKKISRKSRHIQTFNHSLFLPDDPNLLNFRQGRMSDCYLLAAVGAFVYNNPKTTVRAMITPQADSGFNVQFGNGKIVKVGPMTDAELEMGVSEGQNRGYWLSVLEKAYAELRKEKKEEQNGREFEADETVFANFIGHGGTCAPVMEAFTGYQTAKAPIKEWRKEDPQAVAEKTHQLLTMISKQHRLMTAGTGGDKTIKLPKGIPHKHAFGILDYNPANRMVKLFNPWGNHVKPSGPPGPVNGYPTEHGIFEVPLDEFLQIFGGFIYQTDKLAAAH